MICDPYLVKCPKLLVFLTNLPKSNSKWSLFGTQTNWDFQEGPRENRRETWKAKKKKKLWSKDSVADNR